MTNRYDGFIVLDNKSKKTYKFKYVKGTKNTEVESNAIAKLASSTKSPTSNFMVHGFVQKGEWNNIKKDTIDEASGQNEYKEGDLVKFKDDKEVWQVVKAGMRNSNDRVQSNEVTIKPYDALAKRNNVSVPIDITIEYLNANTEKINESINKFLKEDSTSSFGGPAGLTKDQTLKVAQKFAAAMSKVEGAKVTVNKRTFEEDGFDLDYNGEEFDGGSYNIYKNGNVVNMAVRENPILGKVTDSVDVIAKNFKKMIFPNVNESVIKEANEMSFINKSRAKSSLDQIKKGKRADGMGKFNAKVFAIKGTQEIELKTPEDLAKYATGYKYGLKESVLKETFIGPFVFTSNTPEKELLAMYHGALDGYANYKTGMKFSKADYKLAYQTIEKLLKKKGVAITEAVYHPSDDEFIEEWVSMELADESDATIDRVIADCKEEWKEAARNYSNVRSYLMDLRKNGDLLGESYIIGENNWKDILSDLKRKGWKIEGWTAIKQIGSSTDRKHIELEHDEGYTGNILWTVYSGDTVVISNGEFDANGLSAKELDKEIWNNIDEADDPEAGEAAPYGSGYSKVNEDAGMVIDVAMGVAVGLMGLWSLVQSAPLVGRVFGDAAEYLANKSAKKAKLA